MSDTQIIDNIHTKEQFMEELAKYGKVDTEIDLPQITNKETSEVTEQIWHQDGLQIEKQPKWQALWCEYADDNCPSTQYLSTRIPESVALKFIDYVEGYDFRNSIEEGSFFKFEKESHKRLYLKRTYKGKRKLILKDDIGYYTRWCPLSSAPEDEIKELKDAVFSNPVEEIEWKTGRMVMSNNLTCLHRRTPNKNVTGKRLLSRAYVHKL